MAEDHPIAYRADGSPIYDNAETVVCVLASIDGKSNNLIYIRRKSGLFGLPGGFQMRETWQQAGIRELYEETGFVLNPDEISQMLDVQTDSYGHNMIFADALFAPQYDSEAVLDGEALEVLVGDPWWHSIDQWEFPLHFYAMKKWRHR